MAADRRPDVLVPVGESATLRRTVAYAVEVAHEAAVEAGEPATVHFVFPARWRVFEAEPEAVETAESLLERAVIWAREDLEELGGIAADDGDADAADAADGAVGTVGFERGIVGDREYVFSPGDFADVVGRYADGHGVDRIVVDPEFRPGGSVPLLRSFEAELADRGFSVEEAPVTRRTRRQLPFAEIGLREFLAVFAASFLFYLALGGWHVTDGFELATGALTAGVVTVTLASVSIKQAPEVGRTLRTLVRLAAYTPVLLWEIAKANVVLAYVVLHPRLPIGPRFVEFDAAVWGDMPVTTLANSITLTPGTLTVDVSRQHFLVHALIPDAEADLLGGALERLVRFVFYGRAAARLPSPLERAESEANASGGDAAEGGNAAGDGTGSEDGTGTVPGPEGGE
ncbi:MAG: monovalent cation/H+ antiporter subunit E [Haloferacaceae archaeon]